MKLYMLLWQVTRYVYLFVEKVTGHFLMLTIPAGGSALYIGQMNQFTHCLLVCTPMLLFVCNYRKFSESQSPLGILASMIILQND